MKLQYSSGASSMNPKRTTGITVRHVLAEPLYPVSIKDEGLVVHSQLHVRPAARSGPTHPHVASRQRLKLKVPLPRLHGVRLLHAEEADGLGALIVHLVDTLGARRDGDISGFNLRHTK